jgi:hypothetical protein
MRSYKIIFKDGTTQTVKAGSGPHAQGDWLVFSDGSGELLRVRAEDVESVIREGVPERERSESPEGQRSGKVHGF